MWVNASALSGVLARSFSGQSGETAFGVVVPPSLEGARGKVAPAFGGPWTCCFDPQAFGERDSLLELCSKVADDLKAGERE